jgi:zinc protease
MATGRRGGTWRVGGVLSLAVAGAFGASCLGTAGTPPSVHTFPTRTYTMPSGLRVAVEQDDAARVVGIACVVEVGHGDDPVGKPGLAHLVEHLLYSLPDETGRSTWRRLTDLGAGDVNAKTESDRTTFFSFVRRAALADLAGILVSRLGDPAHGLTEASLAKERQVLREELTLGDRDGKKTLQAMLNSLTDRRFVFALDDARAALDAITVDDVRAFVNTYYRPERMTLVLSGPIPPDGDRALLNALPSRLAGSAFARREPVRRPLSPLVARAAQPGIVTVPEAVVEPQLYLAWSLPPARGKALIPFRMAANLATRVLTTQAESGELRAVGGGTISTVESKAANVFLAHVSLRPGADPEAARREVRRVLDLIVALPVARWLAGARARAELNLQEERVREALAMEDLVSRTLRRAALAHDVPDETLSDGVAAVLDTSLEGVASLIENQVGGAPARSLLLVPRARSAGAPPRGPAPPLAGQAGDDLGDDPDLDEDAALAAHEPRDVVAVAQGPDASGAHMTQLPNGLTLIALRRPGLPFVTTVLGFHASPELDERPAVRLTVPYAVSFPGTRGPLERGILESARVTSDAYFETLGMFSSSIPAALDLLSDETTMMSVAWPSPAGRTWAARMTTLESTPAENLSRSFEDLLFGGHRYRLDVRAEQLRAVANADIHAWLARVRRPANGALVVVGDFDETTLARAAASELSGWSGDPSLPALGPVPPASAPPSRKVAAVDARRTWTEVRFACFLPPVRALRDAVVGEILGRALWRELFRELRTDRGTTYATSVREVYYRGGTHVMRGSFDVDASAAPAAVQLLDGWLSQTGSTTLDPRAIERARWVAARLSGLRDGTNAALAQRLFGAWNMGWAPASLDDYPRDLASVTPDEVQAALATCRASSVSSVLSPGP